MANLDLTSVKPNFDLIVSKLEEDLKTRESWTDLYADATGETLIHFNAAVCTMGQWAIEKALKECFISTANRDSSIYAATRMLGIRIARKLPGVQLCSLKRTNKVNLPITSGLTIPAYTQFYINGNIPFFNKYALNFIGTSNQLDEVFLTQGSVVVKTYLSDGTAFQQLILSSITSMSISDADIVVTVDNEEYKVIQDGLWNYGATDKVVVDGTLGTGDVILQFGNGYNGAIPPQGSSVVIKYVETMGSKQVLIPTSTSILAPSQLYGFEISGETIKANQNSEMFSSITTGLSIQLDSLSTPLLKAYLPMGSVWDTKFVGLKLESSLGGVALILGVSGNIANLSLVKSFTSRSIPAGKWSVGFPSTGSDEKSAAYYKVLAPSLRKANDRAVTDKDHSAIFLYYPGISDVLVRTEKDLIRKTIVPKSTATIEKEKLMGVYTGVDNYEFFEDPNPALYNVIWVSLLTQSGLTLTTDEKSALTSWFSSKQLSGSRIRFQDPIKTPINLHLDIKVFKGVDTVSITNNANKIVSDIFKPDKPILSKKIAVSDIYEQLSVGLKSFQDSCVISNIVSNTNGILTLSPLTDAHLNPVTAGIDSKGFPTPPGYLYLNSLIINSTPTDR